MRDSYQSEATDFINELYLSINGHSKLLLYRN